MKQTEAYTYVHLCLQHSFNVVKNQEMSSCKVGNEKMASHRGYLHIWVFQNYLFFRNVGNVARS